MTADYETIMAELEKLSLQSVKPEKFIIDLVWDSSELDEADASPGFSIEHGQQRMFFQLIKKQLRYVYYSAYDEPTFSSGSYCQMGYFLSVDEFTHFVRFRFGYGCEEREYQTHVIMFSGNVPS